MFRLYDGIKQRISKYSHYQKVLQAKNHGAFTKTYFLLIQLAYFKIIYVKLQTKQNKNGIILCFALGAQIPPLPYF